MIPASFEYRRAATIDDALGWLADDPDGTKLLAGGLVTAETEGRHRYYRLAGAHVAQAMEHLAAIRPESRRKTLSPEGRRLRFCRRCYDHLAGRVGVALTAGMVSRQYLRPAPGKRFEVTAAGADWLAAGQLAAMKTMEPTHQFETLITER